MDELFDYFDPVNPSDFKTIGLRDGFYGKSLITNGKTLSSDRVQIALISLNETRNAYPEKYASSVDLIRKYFYQLSEISRVNVVDLGNLKLGKKINDTYASVNHVAEILIAKQIIPIFIGGSQEICVSILSGMLSHLKEPGLAIIDSHIDSEADDFHSKSYIQTLIKQFEGKLQLSVVGYQSYFVNNAQIDYLNDNFVEAIRLGNVRNSLTQTEPILRDADLISFDLSSIRQSDCPASTHAGPNGFYSEEACQLVNVAGMSDKMKAFAVCEYQSDKDTNSQSANLVAQLIWHFIYGFSQRKGDYPSCDLSEYKKIYVRFEKTDSELVFYKNEQNNRFWVEIPMNNKGKKRIISCSESDYLEICNDQVPDRIWKNICRDLK